jgi:hypothetical protein
VLNPTRSRYRPAGRFEALIGKYVDKDVVFGIRAEHINKEPKADGQVTLFDPKTENALR